MKPSEVHTLGRVRVGKCDWNEAQGCWRGKPGSRKQNNPTNKSLRKSRALLREEKRGIQGFEDGTKEKAGIIIAFP